MRVPSFLSLRFPALRRVCVLAISSVLLVLSLGCARFRPKPPDEFVYVMAKQTFLRDKVAAVSNRVATVQNGQKLTVLEHGRRFLLVRTDKGETGWIEERSVVDPAIVTGFENLTREHVNDPVVATAVVRDDLYMHLKPGRDTERFYLLSENEKLQLLVRASVPKATPPQAPKSSLSSSSSAPGETPKPPPPKKPLTVTGKGAAKHKGRHAQESAEALKTISPDGIPMEDWWLTRDSQGRVGWLLARRLDVDVPDAIGGYSEGQKMVGAYILNKVFDPESNLPGNLVPEYVSVLGPYLDGLPYDFDQVRVFTWNTKKHRYETAYRQRDLQGHLPVVIDRQVLDAPTRQTPNPEATPTFAFKQGVGDGVTIDPQTGAVRPSQTETELYRMDGAIVRKVVPQAPPAANPAPSASAPGKSAALKPSPPKGRRRSRSRRAHPAAAHSARKKHKRAAA